MVTKLFVFGPPGSGKSTVGRAIVEHVQYKYIEWSAQRVCDYNILYKMFKQEEKKYKDFYPIKNGGFYVTNPERYNHAVQLLERSVRSVNPKGNRLLVIEFTRSDYSQAFEVFGEGFFQNAGFLFVYADLDICMGRIAQRIKNPFSIDDHYVSEPTLAKYEGKDDGQYPLMVFSNLENKYSVKNSRLRILNSSGSLHDTIKEATVFADKVIRQGTQLRPWEANAPVAHSQSLRKDEELSNELWTPSLGDQSPLLIRP